MSKRYGPPVSEEINDIVEDRLPPEQRKRAILRAIDADWLTDEEIGNVFNVCRQVVTRIRKEHG